MARAAAGSRRTTPRAGPSRGSKTSAGLRVRCRVRVDRSLAGLGGIAASLLDDLADGDQGYRVDLLLTETVQRVSYGIGPKAMTVVHRSTGGLDVWDHANESLARIPASLIPRNRIAPSGNTSVDETAAEGGRRFTITTNDPGLGPLRHVITVSERKEHRPFGPALMRVLHCGAGCHAGSGLPWARIAEAGLISGERTFVKGKSRPVSELVVESVELVKVSARDFEPPASYRPMEKVIRTFAPRAPEADPDQPTAAEIQAEVVRQGLEGEPRGKAKARKFLQDLTPDCLGSTRFGSVAATIHQDLFTVAANTANLIAPLIGPTTIAGGTWTIPWLGSLGAIAAATPNAPGSGVFCLLRQPRTVGSPPFPGPGGGGGLLDRIAFLTLYQRDAMGLMRTQREFAAGTLAATLASWGAGPPASTNLIAAGGDLSALSLTDQQSLVEAYETMELGTVTIGGLGVSATPFPVGSITMGGVTTPPLFTVGVTGIAGTANFGALAGPFVTAATIGASGNVVLGLSLPPIALTGTITRATTLFGSFIAGLGTVAICLLAPHLCPLAIVLVVLIHFILNNVTVVRATATGVTWTVDVTFDFDPATERVEPFVSLLSRTGTIAVSTFGRTPNLIANAVDSLIAALGNAFDLWGSILAAAGVPEIEKLLRNQGLQLPVAGKQNNLRAVSGGASSSAGALLELTADIRPVDEVATQPFTTQVATSEQIKTQLVQAHLDMRNGLNPQPATVPGPGPAITVGSFVGLGVSQNAINYYLYSQWIAKRFEVTITDPATIARFMSVAPPGLLKRFPVQIHLWPAVPPRAEMAPDEIGSGTRPLVVFFDDVRACFEVTTNTGTDGTAALFGMAELQANFRTGATVEVTWPWVFEVRLDQRPLPSANLLELRTWEFADPNQPAIMGPLAPADLIKMVDAIADAMVAPMNSTGVSNPTAVRPWTRPLPAMQQNWLFPPVVLNPPLMTQQVYLEMMARRKALYLLPAIDVSLLELVDGSGAVTLNTLLLPAASAPGPIPTTVAAMRCAQGGALRDWLFPLTGPPAGP